MISANPCSGILVMGVCGVGKSTVGRLLAGTLGWTFVEADDFHSNAAKEKMALGIGLTDKDRGPWLETINRDLKQRPSGWVLACSALKQSYRAVLVKQLPDVAIVWLHGNDDLLRLRLRRRESHYAGESLLISQLADLDPPNQCLPLDVVSDPQTLVTEILKQRSLRLTLKRPVLIPQP